MMSTHTMTGAVNLSSNRNNMLTTMAMSRPLRGQRDGGVQKVKDLTSKTEIGFDCDFIRHVCQQGAVCVCVCGNWHENPRPGWSKVLEDLDADIFGIEAIDEIPDGSKDNMQDTMWRQDEKPACALNGCHHTVKSSRRFFSLLVLTQIKQDRLKRPVTPLHDTGGGCSTTPKNSKRQNLRTVFHTTSRGPKPRWHAARL